MEPSPVERSQARANSVKPLQGSQTWSGLIELHIAQASQAKMSSPIKSTRARSGSISSEQHQSCPGKAWRGLFKPSRAQPSQLSPAKFRPGQSSLLETNPATPGAVKPSQTQSIQIYFRHVWPRPVDTSHAQASLANPAQPDSKRSEDSSPVRSNPIQPGTIKSKQTRSTPIRLHLSCRVLPEQSKCIPSQPSPMEAGQTWQS